MLRLYALVTALLCIAILSTPASARFAFNSLIKGSEKAIEQGLLSETERTRAALTVMLASAGSTPANASCDDLQDWIRAGNAAGNYEVLPGISVSNLFSDTSVLPVFGRSVVTWTRDDFNALRGQLAKCRRLVQADREMQALYNTALKAAKGSARAMRTKWNAQTVAERNANSLLRQRNAPQYAEILAIARKALEGGDTSADLQGLEPRARGLGRQAADLAKHRAYLSKDEIAGYLARFAETQEVQETQTAARNEKLDALLQEIASVPVSQAGLSQLYRIANRTDIAAMSRQDATAYNKAFQARRAFINRQLAQQQTRAKQALASQPAPVAARLDAILGGKLGPAMTVAGLKTGMSLADVRSTLATHMGYKESATFSNSKQFTTVRRELSRYTKQEGRDGGLVNIQTKSGEVGRIAYIEHFTGPIDAKSLQTQLTKNFGKPKDVRVGGAITELSWARDGHVLKVIAGRRIADPARQRMNYRSSVEVLLQSEAFIVYLQGAKKHCAHLRDKPSGQLSMNDKQAILTGCLTP